MTLRVMPGRPTLSGTLCLGLGLGLSSLLAFGQTRVIEVVADKDSRYKIEGQRTPVITVKAGESIELRITARKGKSWNRDGSIHGFSLLRAKDRSKVPGWDLLLRPGTQEFALIAPTEPGEYEVVCTVICSEDHEGMRMKFVVLP
jgi:heme/copper-type cytochrome/quinol oxidase subunit 2